MTRRPINRRAYLRAVGSAGAVGLAGCLGDGGAGEEPETTAAPDMTDEMTTEPTAAPEQELTAGTAPGFPPFEIKEGGELTGFDIDLLEAVVEAAEGYTLAGWSEFEFDSLIPALTSENIDVIAAAMTITDDRDATIDFSDPYWSADQSVVVRDGEGDQYGELGDLSGTTVGAQSGTTGEGVVQDELIANGVVNEGDYRAFDNYVLAIQSLENGDVDAVVIDEPVAQTFADQRAVEVAFVYETGEEYGFGLREGESDLQSALNAGLAAVRDDGTYDELTATWFGQA